MDRVDSHRETILITGVLGCLGSWVARCALARGHAVVGYDTSNDRERLGRILGDDADQVDLVRGDVTSPTELGRAVDERQVTRLLHLAALQVPTVRAAPARGFDVNVGGTLNVFEVAAARLDRIHSVVFASSAAVYSHRDPSPAPESGGAHPQTLYGLTKLACEGIARLYWHDRGVRSAGLRPLVVYGLGRDSGLTSEPSIAMARAARGLGSTISFSGDTQFDYVADVAMAFVMMLETDIEKASVYNTRGTTSSVEDVASIIDDLVSGSDITVAGDPLPFPSALEASGFERDIGSFPHTDLHTGIAATIAAHRPNAH